MKHGTVKWFSDQKGIGFISPDGGGGDLFAHFSAFDAGLETLAQGQKVLFRLTGKQATKIRPA